MNIIRKLILCGFATLVFSGNSYAECTRSYVCDDWGNNCKYMDICNDSLDLPSVGLDPLPSLPTTDLKPLPSVDLPPLGTSNCEYKQVNGRWQNICW
ncbi:MAG: hypothetical protein L3J98_16005 [Gammaproteobacteria bacterium]|nr:hypothetical protein [Gammaproteobacteria bacterium]